MKTRLQLPRTLAISIVNKVAIQTIFYVFVFVFCVLAPCEDAVADVMHRVYVWDFESNESIGQEYPKLITMEFEEKLIHERCFHVLERRSINKVFSHRENELKISSIKDIPISGLEALKQSQAKYVIFGYIYDDIRSGQIRVSATLQDLFNETKIVYSVKFLRGKIFDVESREAKMEELASKFCSSFALECMDLMEEIQSHEKEYELLKRKESVDRGIFLDDEIMSLLRDMRSLMEKSDRCRVFFDFSTVDAELAFRDNRRNIRAIRMQIERETDLLSSILEEEREIEKGIEMVESIIKNLHELKREYSNISSGDSSPTLSFIDKKIFLMEEIKGELIKRNKHSGGE